MIAPPGWDDILDEGETILWQGRPAPGISLLPIRPMQMAMGVFFVAFATFWTSMAFSMTWSAPQAPWFFRYIFPLFGLLFVGIGLHMAGGYAVTRALARRYTFYTLTDRRAFIATNLPWQGRRLKSWPISAATVIDHDGGFPGTIRFAEERRRGRGGSYAVPIGFERIEEADKVHRLMREIQKRQPA